jgi:3-isopropylmalate dehydrogenase
VENFGMYEPIHGSAPDIAGQNIANPMATILSVGMMLRYTFGLSKEADAIEAAVRSVLRQGYRTQDLMSQGMQAMGTEEAGDRIAAEI